jgi:uncharacterized protein YxeA
MKKIIILLTLILIVLGGYFYFNNLNEKEKSVVQDAKKGVLISNTRYLEILPQNVEDLI